MHELLVLLGKGRLHPVRGLPDGLLVKAHAIALHLGHGVDEPVSRVIKTLLWLLLLTWVQRLTPCIGTLLRRMLLHPWLKRCTLGLTRRARLLLLLLDHWRLRCWQAWPWQRCLGPHWCPFGKSSGQRGSDRNPTQVL